MDNIMQYKGYVGSVEFSEKDGLFYGRLLGIRSLVSYEGRDAASLVADFHGAVDDYLAACEADGTAPETPYKGSTSVRFKQGTYRRMAIYTTRKGQSINSFVEEACEEKLARLAA